MNENITKFLRKQTCASIACVDEANRPASFNCFFAFDDEHGLLHYKSSAASMHSRLLNAHPLVAGTVLPDKLNKLAVQGVQFEGRILNRADALTAKSAQCYHKKFPMALAIPGEMWTVQVERIKMTDSKLGFGKKIVWERDAASLS